MIISKEVFSGVVIIVAIVIFLGFIFINKNSQQEKTEDIKQDKLLETQEWAQIEIKDIRTATEFKILDFKDKPILLESFAVWCPVCTKQQGEIKKLQEELDDNIILISLDTDPNEDEQRVKEHIESNGFEWYYAISPSTMTQSLIDVFGTGIVNAPSAPIILICADGKYRKLGSGVKDVEELKAEIEKC